MIRIAIVLVALGHAAVASAGDDPETAAGQAYFVDGSALYERGDYPAAAKLFARGYALEPWSGFLFAWAQADRLAGSCVTAIELYGRFIATEPSGPARALAIEGIALCGGRYVAPPPAASPPPASPPTPAPGFPHKLAIALAAAGAVSGGIAVQCYLWSTRDARAATTAEIYAETQRLYDRSRSRLTISRVAGAIGVGFALASAVRFVLHRGEPARVELAITPAGMVGLAGRF